MATSGDVIVPTEGWASQRASGAQAGIRHLGEEAYRASSPSAARSSHPASELATISRSLQGGRVPAPDVDLSTLRGWERSLVHLQSTVGELDAAGAATLGKPDVGAVPFVTKEEPEATLEDTGSEEPERSSPGRVRDSGRRRSPPPKLTKAADGRSPGQRLPDGAPRILDLLPLAPNVRHGAAPVANAVLPVPVIASVVAARALARAASGLGDAPQHPAQPSEQGAAGWAPGSTGSESPGSASAASPPHAADRAGSSTPMDEERAAKLVLSLVKAATTTLVGAGRADASGPVSESLSVLPPPPPSLEHDPDSAATMNRVYTTALGLVELEARHRGGFARAARAFAELKLDLDQGFSEFAALEEERSGGGSPPRSAGGKSRLPLSEAVSGTLHLLSTRRETITDGAAGKSHRDQVAIMRQASDLRDRERVLQQAWESHQHRAAVDACMGSGLHACRVVLAAQRVPVLTIRQDLALCRRHLLVALAETSAVEVDVVGRTGGRLGSTGTDGAPRARIIQEMPRHDAARYAEQAAGLLRDVQAPGAADAMVGTPQVRASFQQLSDALGDTAAAARASAEERAAREREMVLSHIRQVVPVLEDRRRVAAEATEKQVRLAAELERMRNAVAAIKDAQGGKVAALAEAVARAENRTDLSGQGAVEQLAVELDVSEDAVSSRLANEVAVAEAEAEAEAEEAGTARLRRAEEDASRALAEEEASIATNERGVRSGGWMRMDKSPTERRLEAMRTSTAELRREAESLQARIKGTESKVAAAMRLAKDGQRLTDAKRDTRRMFGIRRTPPRVVVRFFADSLKAAPYSPALLRGLKKAQQELLDAAETAAGAESKPAAGKSPRALREATSPGQGEPAASAVRVGRSGATGAALALTSMPASGGLGRAGQAPSSPPAKSAGGRSGVLARLQALLRETTPSRAGAGAGATGARAGQSRAMTRDEAVKARARRWMQADMKGSSTGPADGPSSGQGGSASGARATVQSLLDEVAASPERGSAHVQNRLEQMLRRSDSPERDEAEAAIDSILARVRRRLRSDSDA